MIRMGDDIMSRESGKVEEARRAADYSTVGSAIRSLHNFLSLYVIGEIGENASWYGIDHDVRGCLEKLGRFEISDSEGRRLIDKLVNRVEEFLLEGGEELLEVAINIIYECMGYKERQ